MTPKQREQALNYAGNVMSGRGYLLPRDVVDIASRILEEPEKEDDGPYCTDVPRLASSPCSHVNCPVHVELPEQLNIEDAKPLGTNGSNAMLLAQAINQIIRYLKSRE